MKYTVGRKPDPDYKYVDLVIPRLIPLDLIDAEGNRISGADIEAFDTETGIVHCYMRDEHGNLLINHEEGCIERVIRKYPAPLTIHSLTKEELEQLKSK